MISNPVLSIVSPIYKAELFVEKLVFELKKAIDTLNISYEIILVDDRSPDNSWIIMKELSFKFKEVKSIKNWD